jgi:mRNA-degrading endonuclease toxin of MazEF toxin-antitoxin module
MFVSMSYGTSRCSSHLNVVDTGFESIVMPHQIRTISKLRLLGRIGTLTDEDLQVEIENRVLEHLGIAFEAEEP